MAVFLTFYDGADCIGGNKILLEDGSASLLLDFGTNFKAEGMYFDEFLNPRTTFGFSDLLALDILPPLQNLYRPDFEYPGVWERFAGHPACRPVEVHGVLLSHPHLDHCGHLTYLRQDIPIYTSLASAAVCKALQDTGSGEVCYAVPRELRDGLIRTADYRRVPAEQRPYRVFGCSSVNPEVAAFWERCDASRCLSCTPLEPCDTETDIGGLRVRFWPVDHSVPGAGAFGIKTSADWVIYTGDLRLHGKRGWLTGQFISEAAKLKPAVLICEGTHPEVGKPVTEEEVAANCFEAAKRKSGLVVADFGPRNVERLLSFLEIAGETDRLLVLTPKDVYILEALRAAGEPGVPDPYADSRIALYVCPKAVRQKWEDALLARFGERAPERLVNAAKVKTDQGSFILCFSYYDFHAFLDIEPRGGTYIYSSSEAFNEEMLLDHEKVRNWIDFFGFRFYGSLGREREGSGFHASGHIHGPGIEEMVETIRPEILIPVHTENRDFFRRFEGTCRVVYPQKGESIVLG
ncbi:beta-lactamase domain protein [Candidatus Desulforudis audaxviator MP104C]|uniref:Beta-lactamase domain protein n=2 Tax=Thermoanaerobacterales TaxID=68295 RepID=B1I2X8_DESAP|nr:exonuclease [Candidatus Desulforudis audaxviator]ACA59324.1 beta-lactamase domain protein [Candidatus Desulforudis audaxviator MP104C]